MVICRYQLHVCVKKNAHAQVSKFVMKKIVKRSRKKKNNQIKSTKERRKKRSIPPSSLNSGFGGQIMEVSSVECVGC